MSEELACATAESAPEHAELTASEGQIQIASQREKHHSYQHANIYQVYAWIQLFLEHVYLLFSIWPGTIFS